MNIQKSTSDAAAISNMGLSDAERHACHDAVSYAKQLGAEQSSAHLYSSQGFDLTVRNQTCELLEHAQEQGLSIEIIHQQRQGSASTQDLSTKSIQQAVQKAYDMSRFTSADPHAGLADQAELAKDFVALDIFHPWQLDVPQATELVKTCEAEALGYTNHAKRNLTLQSEGSSISTYKSYSAIATSQGFAAERCRSSHSISCSMLAKHNQLMQRDHEYSTHCNPQRLMPINNIAHSACEKTIARSGARKLSTRTCSVIFDAHTARSLWGALLKALSGSAQYRKQSFLLDSLGKQIAPKWLQLHQKPHLKQASASANYDQEGVQTRELCFVEQGRVNSYILGSYSARQLGLKTTGNAGGVQNLIIPGQAANTKELLAEMQQGLLVTELMGQGVNPITGDYSRGAFGYWVENGNIQYPVHEITLAGNLLHMLQHMRGCSNDLDQRYTIQCGALWVGDMTLAGT